MGKQYYKVLACLDVGEILIHFICPWKYVPFVEHSFWFREFIKAKDGESILHSLVNPGQEGICELF